MLWCPSCEKDLPEEAFGVNRARENGLQRTCKVCLYGYQKARRDVLLAHRPPRELKTADIIAYRRAYWAKNREKYNKLRAISDRKKAKEDPGYFKRKSRKRYEAKMHRLHGPDWQPYRHVPADEGELARRRTARNKRKRLRAKERYPERLKAKAVLHQAIRRFKVIRQPCWVCGNLNTHGHHPDYSAPLDVVWLCRVHHEQLHKEHKK